MEYMIKYMIEYLRKDMVEYMIKDMEEYLIKDIIHDKIHVLELYRIHDRIHDKIHGRIHGTYTISNFPRKNKGTQRTLVLRRSIYAFRITQLKVPSGTSA